VNSPFKFLPTDLHQFSTDTFFMIPLMTTADGIIIPISLTADWPLSLLGNWPFKNPRGPLPLRMESVLYPEVPICAIFSLCIWVRVVTKIRFRPSLHYFAICVFQKPTYKFHPATFPIVQILLCKCFITQFYFQLYCIFTLITSVCCLFLQYFDD
jgi:hypothetical protein